MPRISIKTIESLASLRLLVGRLGEKDNYGWWSTSMLSTLGVQYHQILFPRTFSKSSALATFKAAKNHHDKEVGTLRSYHLFRLPSDIEKRIFESLEGVPELPGSGSQTECLNLLRTFTSESVENTPGPVHLGDAKEISKPQSVNRVASFYFNAFVNGQNCIPYFTNA
jgi:hypothetical protein